MKKDKSTIQSVDRALTILSLFREAQFLGVTEIAEKMGLAKSTTYGLIATLEKHRYLDQDPLTGKYRLGIRLLELGELFNERLDLRREASAVMRRVAEECGETVQLSVLDGNEVVYIDLVEAPASLRYVSRIGKRVPAHCSATGKVMLADLPEHVLDLLYTDSILSTRTPRSISSLIFLKEHLKLVREQGYSLDDEEHEIGVRGVAAAIRNGTGKVVAALSVGGPISRVTYEKAEEFSRVIREAAHAISLQLGSHEKQC